MIQVMLEPHPEKPVPSSCTQTSTANTASKEQQQNTRDELFLESHGSSLHQQRQDWTPSAVLGWPRWLRG